MSRKSTIPDPFKRPHGNDEKISIEHSTLKKGLFVYGVSKTIKKRPILQGVSLSLQGGEAVGLLGPNGAGKTTCFSIITGALFPDEGEVILDATPMTRHPIYERSRLGLGYLPQDTSIFRGMSVEGNILSVLELSIKDLDKREDRLNVLLDEFSLSHLRHASSNTLSGGERRRVEIARCLAIEPRYILLDEPFAGIDPIAVSEIRELIKHLTKRGIGVLITDHNVRETLSMVDRAYIIVQGQVLTEGTPENIVSNAHVRRVYLGDNFIL